MPYKTQKLQIKYQDKQRRQNPTNNKKPIKTIHPTNSPM